MRRWLVGAGAVLAGTLLVGCTASNGGASHGANAELRGPVAGKADSGNAGGGVAAPADPAAGGPHGSATGKLLADDSAKIRVAEMTVDVTRGKVTGAADRAESIALGVGGEVDSDDRSSGRYATASLVLRVPPTSLTAVLRELSRLGHERSRQLSTTDVTEKVADVNSRVASAREAIARLRALYANATRVADVISVESELGQRESDLESLEAQQRALQRQTALASITLTLQTATPAAKPAPKHHHSHAGFVGGLSRGWDGFVTAAKWVGTAVGTLLPFLVLLAVLAVAGRFAWRRRPHPAPGPSPAPSE